MDASPMLLASLAAVLGLMIGSFVNVVAHRVPAGQSVVSPPSACPNCQTPIAPYDNIPVLSWLLLRGRCRACRDPISVRYPLVELLTAALFAVLALEIGWHPQLAAFLYLATIGMALALIDLDVHRLPNVLVLPSYVVGLVLLAVASAVLSDWDAYLRGVYGMVILFAVYFLLVLIHPAGMGLGDVKLAGVLGLHLGWLGWSELIVGGWLGFVGGGLVGVLLMAIGKAGRKTALPFGPYMLLGALMGILWGEPVISTYLGT